MTHLTTVDYGNGIVLKYDPTIQPGDLITTYHKGYWKVDRVIPRGKGTPSIEYTKVGGKGSKSCDASYCRKVDPQKLYEEMVEEAGRIRSMLINAQDELGKG